MPPLRLRLPPPRPHPGARVPSWRRPFLAALLLLGGCEARLHVDLAVSQPSDAQALSLAVPYVDLLDTGASVHSFDSAQAHLFDLLTIETGDRVELLSKNDAQGDFAGVRARFSLSGASLTSSDGSVLPLTLAAQPDYLDLDLSLSQNDSETVVLTLELPFSLLDRRNSDGGYELRPVLRAARFSEAGSIDGSIPRSLVEASACRAGRTAGRGVAVYVWPGSDVSPADYFRSDTVTNVAQPLASAGLSYDADNDVYSFTIDHLAPGSYTVAWTCQADQEAPDADDGLSFRDTQSLTLSSSASATVAFDE